MIKTLGEKVKEIRTSRGMSQDAFAKSLGYSSRATINKIEQGINDMTYTQLVKLIEIYQINMNELVNIKPIKEERKNRIIWINGPYGVGKSTLAEKLHELNPNSFIFDAEEVGNAVRGNIPKELFNGYIFENYNLWFRNIVELLIEIISKYSGDIYIPMTLVNKDSFNKIANPLKEYGLNVEHILLESTYEVVHDRILSRGEQEGCWCMNNIELCLANQSTFKNVRRIESIGKTVDELASEVLIRE